MLVPILGTIYTAIVRIIARRTLREFWEHHPDAEQPLRAWYRKAKNATWKTPSDIKSAYRNASFISNNRVVFNIKGNHYRLIVEIKYQYEVVYIRFIGTHSQYDKIDAKTI